jgi:hypothetical protein
MSTATHRDARRGSSELQALHRPGLSAAAEQAQQSENPA